MANSLNFNHDCIDDFNLNYTENIANHFRIAQWNIRGMNDLQKFDSISLFLDNIKVPIEVLVIGETWLRLNNCALYEIPGFNSVFSCRETSFGGLVVYVKDGLNFNVLKNVTFDGFHLIHIEIERNGLFYEIVGLYRPPSFDFNNFINELENILMIHSTRPRFFVGDMNIPINLCNNNIVKRYMYFLESYNYFCSNTCVTRPLSSNILDHFVCSNDDFDRVRNDTIFSDISDHLIILSSLKINNPKESIILNKKLIDKNKLNELFTNYLDDFECNGNINDSINNITNAYNRIATQCTKIKSEKINMKSKHCPWINYYVWQWIKLKHKYLKKVKNDPHNVDLRNMFKHISVKTDEAKRRCKSDYYKQLLDNTCHAKMWKNLNEIMGRSKPKTRLELKTDGGKTSNNTAVCEIFIDYFSQIGIKLAEKIPKINLNPLNNISRIDRSIFLRPASENEVGEIIKELNINKSSGPDGFPSVVIKSNVGKFSNILTCLFNRMLEQGSYPDCLKIGRITPVFKGGDTSDACNYRPISTISVFSKIFEKLLVNRLVKFMSKHNILYKFQYGFRKGCSTTTAIVELVDFLISEIDNKNVIGGLFLDLKKAFDTLDHNILLKKLEYYGVRGLANDIIRSYLKDRQQFVSIENSRSRMRTFNIGVPQGSNIGPLLFLIYINDLGNLPLHGIPRLFADDTAIFYPHGNTSAVICSMNMDLRLLMDYFNSNLLSLNLSKTKYMLFHSPRKKIDPHANLSVGSTVIDKVFNFKYLGLNLDPVLSWINHLDSVQRKISSLCGLIYRVRQFVPRTALLKFYFGCIHSHLQYLIIAWGHACKSKLRKLQVLQNRCIKTIFSLPPLFPTLQLYTQLPHNILPIKGLCDLQVCSFIFDVMKKPNMHCNLVLPSRSHEHNTRHANNLLRCRALSSFGQMRISFYGPSVYNIIPERFKLINNKLLFKTNLKRYYRSKISSFLI